MPTPSDERDELIEHLADALGVNGEFDTSALSDNWGVVELELDPDSAVLYAYREGAEGFTIEIGQLASALLAAGYRRHPVGITDEAVHAAAVVIDPVAWEPGPFYHSKVSSAARDLSLVQARAALEAAEAVRNG